LRHRPTCAWPSSIGSVIEVRVMQALALAACDDEAGALATLADALTLAAPEGYVRVFVDDWPPMAALFARLMTARSARAMLAGGVPVDYLGRLREDLHPDGGSLRGRCGSPLGWPRARPSH
jgi:LuxR family maltose regulon positive regulatory protein